MMKKPKFVTLKSKQSFKYLMLEHQPKRRKSTLEKLDGNPKGYLWTDTRSRWCTSKLETELLKKSKAKLNEKYGVMNKRGCPFNDTLRK